MGTVTRTIKGTCTSNGNKYDGDFIYFNRDITQDSSMSGVTFSSATVKFGNFKSWNAQSYFYLRINGSYVGDTKWCSANSSFHEETSSLYDTTQSWASPNLLLTESVNSIALEVETNGGTTYFYRYDETLSGASGGTKIEITVTGTYPACSAPSSITLNETSGDVHVTAGTTMTLAWSAGGSGSAYNTATGYRIYRNGSQYRDVDLNTRSITVDCPTAGNSYYYTVQTLGSHESSGQTASRTVYAYSAVSAPTSVSINTNMVDAGNAATLSWSGAKNGSGNNVTGYRIYRSTSAGGTYSDIGAAASSPATVYAPSTMGQTYYYKIVAVGQYANSGLSENYAYLEARTYTAVSAPTNVACAPILIQAESLVTLSWSGAEGGTNTSVASYEVYRSTVAGSDYTLLTTTSSTSVSVYAPDTPGNTYFYKIKSIANKSGFDSELSAVYGYVSVPMKPNAPTIQGTTSGKSYNTRPRVLATVPAVTVVGVLQSVGATGWSASRTVLEAAQKVVLRKDAAYSSAGTDNVEFYSQDTFGEATGTTVAVAHEVPTWTDDPVVGGTTPIKAAHINELRQAIDDIRAWYGMTAYTWSETITAGVTSSVNWASHAIEVKEQIEAIQTFVNDWDNTNAVLDIALPVISTFYAPKADVINKLRQAICLL